MAVRGDIGSAVALGTAIVAIAAAVRQANYQAAVVTNTVSVQQLQANPNIPKVKQPPMPYTPPNTPTFYDSLFNHPVW